VTAVSDRAATLMFGTRPRVYRSEEFPRLVEEILVDDGRGWGVQQVQEPDRYLTY
jgi:hypothetical protein